MNPSMDRFSQPIETRWQERDEEIEVEKQEQEYQKEKDDYGRTDLSDV